MSVSTLHSYVEIITISVFLSELFAIEIVTISVFLSQLFAIGRYWDVLSPQNCQDESEGKYNNRTNQEVTTIPDQSGDSCIDRLNQEVTTVTGSINQEVTTVRGSVTR